MAAVDMNEAQLYAKIETHWDTYVVPGRAWGDFIERMKHDGQRMILEVLPGSCDTLRIEMLRRFLRRYGYFGHLTSTKKWVPV